jgi:hypothetical protein
MVLVASVVNCATNSLLNLGLPSTPLVWREHVVVGEVLAVVVEALAYSLAAQPRDFGRALAVSAACNALSFELGGLLAPLL